MKQLIRHRRLHFGMRTIKTGIAVALSVALGKAVSDPYPAFMAIGAINSMERSIHDSIISARNLVLGNFFGAVTGMLFAALFSRYIAFFTGLGIMLVIVFCNALKMRESVPLTCIVFACIACNIEGGTPYLYGITRFLETLAGIAIALAVNLILRPYNNSYKISSLVRADQRILLPLLAKRAYHWEFVDLHEMRKNHRRLGEEIRLYEEEINRRKRRPATVAHLRSCHQLLGRMLESLHTLNSMDTTPMLSEQNVQRMEALGMDSYDPDNALAGKCTDEETSVFNYHVRDFLDANDCLTAIIAGLPEKSETPGKRHFWNRFGKKDS
ncbi:MAG: aromatic acid exporter family protein [Butyricicoccaceae bacterium]